MPSVMGVQCMTRVNLLGVLLHVFIPKLSRMPAKLSSLYLGGDSADKHNLVLLIQQ